MKLMKLNNVNPVEGFFEPSTRSDILKRIFLFSQTMKIVIGLAALVLFRESLQPVFYIFSGAIITDAVLLAVFPVSPDNRKLLNGLCMYGALKDMLVILLTCYIFRFEQTPFVVFSTTMTYLLTNNNFFKSVLFQYAIFAYMICAMTIIYLTLSPFALIFSIAILSILSVWYISQIRIQQEIALKNAELLEKRAKHEKQIKESLREKEILLKEIHHRVKNNLQIISSLLSLQSDYIYDERDRALFTDSQKRILSMALVHEKLYQSINLSEINMQEYIKNLSEDLLCSFCSDSDQVAISIHAEEVVVPIDTAIPCALLINEILSNSIKYAFPGNRNGKITISMNKTDGKTMLIIADDGVGIPDQIGFENSTSMGMMLISALSSQLCGTVHIDRTGGTRFTVVF
jgi:two-component sensor histidine kinase